MKIFDLSFDILEFFAKLGDYITQPLFTIGSLEVSIIGFFSTTILTAVIIAKIVALAIPNQEVI